MHRFAAIVGCFTVSVMFAPTAGAQTAVLTGVVFDETARLGRAGAQVAVKGTNLVATTGKDGRFTLAGVPAGAQEIETRLTGYRPYTLSSLKVAANDTAHLYLSLLANADENRVATWSAGMIKGKIAGVTIRTDGSTEIGIRRSVSGKGPIFIVDGVFFTSGTIPSSIPPEDIVSIEVIKGPAGMTMYGERASDGVVVIRTRR